SKERINTDDGIMRMTRSALKCGIPVLSNRHGCAM
ncbi:hypothetical protein A2U01_0102892, partial [Trifolium medium]|nr:hypothetical protein [Trifolium medium]